MKKTRMILVVAFMLSISLLTFVSQGEELVMTTEQDTVQVYGLSYEINHAKEDMASNPLAQIQKKYIEPDLAINNQEMGVILYEPNKKTTIYDTQRQEHYASDLDERVGIILELTPLDEETAKIVLTYADEYDIRPSLILGIMDLESNFNQYLVGTSQDRGYMQIIPGTEKWLAKAYGEELGLTYNPENIFDPEYNIALAVKYLSVLDEQYKGNVTKMLTSYNRGDAGLKSWYEEHGTYETAYSRVVLKREKKYLEVE
ncbi:MAG: transglycosylase SLT domain-containing protein [Clostridia bacterium]|nr:transglycosylase SLT domain-containing protein [Clostridia bacterium]